MFWCKTKVSHFENSALRQKFDQTFFQPLLAIILLLNLPLGKFALAKNLKETVYGCDFHVRMN